MSRNIEHVCIAGSPTEHIAGWYIDKLDFKTVFRTQGNNSVFILRAPGGSLLEIIPPTEEVSGERTTGLHHMAISSDDIERDVRELELKGVRFDGGVKDVGGGNRVAWFTDPAGTKLQLIQRKNPF